MEKDVLIQIKTIKQLLICLPIFNFNFNCDFIFNYDFFILQNKYFNNNKKISLLLFNNVKTKTKNRHPRLLISVYLFVFKFRKIIKKSFLKR